MRHVVTVCSSLLLFVGIAVPGSGQSVSFARSTVPVLGAPRAIVSADFNGDGHPDLAVATVGVDAAGHGGLGILSNNGHGVFALQATFQTQTGPFSVAAGDLDGDGLPDLAVVDADANLVEVFTRAPRTAFGFLLTSAFATSGSPRGIALGDLNRDGKLDMVVTALDCNCIDVALGQGNGHFVPAGTFSVASGPIAIALADLNHDGRLDVVSAGSSMVTTWLNAGGGQLNGRMDSGLGGNTVRAMQLADLNVNGKIEAVAVTSSNSVSTTDDINQYGFGGFGGFGAGGTDPRGVAVTDINGDGTPDIIVANRGSGTVVVLLAFPLTGFESSTTEPGYHAGATVRVGNGSRAVAIADFDGDGRPDIATGDETAKTVSVLINTTAFAGRP
jgi:hypothetical protein